MNQVMCGLLNGKWIFMKNFLKWFMENRQPKKLLLGKMFNYCIFHLFGYFCVLKTFHGHLFRQTSSRINEAKNSNNYCFIIKPKLWECLSGKTTISSGIQFEVETYSLHFLWLTFEIRKSFNFTSKNTVEWWNSLNNDSLLIGTSIY